MYEGPRWEKDMVCLKKWETGTAGSGCDGIGEGGGYGLEGANQAGEVRRARSGVIKAASVAAMHSTEWQEWDGGSVTS